jgi:hypothetical protein
MRRLILLLFYAAYGLVELDPINQQERNDEVAQAQQESIWIACLVLAFNKLESSAEAIQATSQKYKHPSKDVRKKLALDILDRCTKQLPWREADLILYDENLDLEKSDFKSLVKINLNQFDKKIEFTQSQLNLLKKIEEEIQLAEPNVPEPPVDEGFDIFQEKIGFTYYIIGGFVLLVVIIILSQRKPLAKVPPKATITKKKKN